MVELQFSVSEAEAKGLVLPVSFDLDDSTAPVMCISKLHTADHSGQGLSRANLSPELQKNKSMCPVDSTLATTSLCRAASITTVTLLFQEPK